MLPSRIHFPALNWTRCFGCWAVGNKFMVIWQQIGISTKLQIQLGTKLAFIGSAPIKNGHQSNITRLYIEHEGYRNRYNSTDHSKLYSPSMFRALFDGNQILRHTAIVDDDRMSWYWSIIECCWRRRRFGDYRVIKRIGWRALRHSTVTT